MKRTLALVFVLALSLVAADGNNVNVSIVIQADPNFKPGTGTYRHLNVVEGNYGVYVKGYEFDASNSGGVVSDSLSGFSYSFVNPGAPGTLNSNGDLGLYLGYLSAGINWNAGAKIASVSGALAEVSASFPNIFVYYDRDGTPGFQTTATSLFWDCNYASSGQDCMDSANTLDVTTFSWSAIGISNYSCGASYPANCQVYVFTTTGYSSGLAVLTFTFKLASHPVLVNGVSLKPNFGKLDITINYPWSKATNLGTSPKVGLSLLGSGRTSSWAGVIAPIADLGNGNNGLMFTGTAAHTYFAWDGSATINNTQSNVHVTGFTAAAFSNFACSADFVTCTVYDIWKAIYVTILTVLQVTMGWKVQFVYFSWNEIQPASVFWDPQPGAGPGGNSASGAFLPSGSIAFVLGSALMLLWNQFF